MNRKKAKQYKKVHPVHIGMFILLLLSILVISCEELLK